MKTIGKILLKTILSLNADVGAKKRRVCYSVGSAIPLYRVQVERNEFATIPSFVAVAFDLAIVFFETRTRVVKNLKNLTTTEKSLKNLFVFFTFQSFRVREVAAVAGARNGSETGCPW